MADLYWTWELQLLGFVLIGIFFFFYARYRFRIAREWRERDQARVDRIMETGEYEPMEKPYWK